MQPSSTSFLTARPAPEVARRTWPRWLALGTVMIAVAVAGVLWQDAGARLLLGGLGVFLVVRGAVLLRGARTGALDGELARRATRLGAAALAGGALVLGAALVSATLAGRVLLVAVPVLLLGGALGLLARGAGTAGADGPRRGARTLLVRSVLTWAALAWSVLVVGLLVASGLAQGWSRAADVATVVAALVVAVLAVPMLVAAANLRTVAAQPAPAATRPAGCAGCACGAGGCGAG